MGQPSWRSDLVTPFFQSTVSIYGIYPLCVLRMSSYKAKWNSISRQKQAKQTAKISFSSSICPFFFPNPSFLSFQTPSKSERNQKIMRGGTVQINWHDTKPILTLDFHPLSGTLATGGADYDIKVSPLFSILLVRILLILSLRILNFLYVLWVHWVDCCYLSGWKYGNFSNSISRDYIWQWISLYLLMVIVG